MTMLVKPFKVTALQRNNRIKKKSLNSVRKWQCQQKCMFGFIFVDGDGVVYFGQVENNEKHLKNMKKVFLSCI